MQVKGAATIFILTVFLSLLPAVPCLGESRLIFPDVTQGAGVEVGVALLNPMSGAAKATFSAFSETGQLIQGSGITNPVTLDVPADGQLARFGREIFGFPANAPIRGWMEVTSASNEVKGFFLTLQNGLERVDGAEALTKTGKSFLLPLAPGMDAVTSVLHIVNPGAIGAQVTMRLVGESGSVLQEALRQVPAKGKLDSPLADLLSRTLNARRVYLSIDSTEEIVVYQLFRTGRSIAGSKGLPKTAVPVLYSPHLAAGGPLATTLQLVAFAGAPQTLRLTARGDDGKSLQGATQNPREVTLPPGALFEVDVERFFGLPASQLHSGWVEIVNTVTGQPVSAAGSITFGAREGGTFNASLPLQGEGNRINFFSHVAQGSFGPLSWFTGLAFLNAGETEAVLSITVRDPAGKVTGSGGLVLPPRGRVSRLLPELIPDFGKQAGGSIGVTSSRPVLAFSLFGLSDLSLLAAIPTQPLISPFTVLHGSQPVAGTIRAPLIHVPKGVTLRSGGPLEFVAEEVVLVEGDIISSSSVTLESPGEIIIVGRIDTSATTTSSVSISSAATSAPMDSKNIPGTDINLRGGNITISNDLNTGDGTEIGQSGGRMRFVGRTLRFAGDSRGPTIGDRHTVVQLKTGSGGPGKGANSAGGVIPAGNGGDIELNFDQLSLLLTAHHVTPAGDLFNVTALLALRTGRGGIGGFFRFSDQVEAHGAPGGRGGDIKMAMRDVPPSRTEIFIATGSGGGGQDARADGALGVADTSVTAIGGDGGRGGNVDLLGSASQLGEVTRFDPGAGGLGGSATALPDNGKSPGDHGRDGTALGGRGGDGGRGPVLGRSPAGCGFGGEVTVKGGNGRRSMQVGVNGGSGGNIVARVGEEGRFCIRLGAGVPQPQVLIERAGNGGAGFSGCQEQEVRRGSAGGQGGQVNVRGTKITIFESANGGDGGHGSPPGEGGAAGLLFVEDSIDRLPEFSFEKGKDGKPCPVQFRMSLSPSTLSFEAPKDGPTQTKTAQLNLTDSTDTLRSFSTTTNKPWLTATQTGSASQSKPASIQVTVDPKQAGEGAHTGTVRVSVSGAANSPANIDVILQVVGDPKISSIEPASGTQGDTLDATIQGENLTGFQALEFSGSGVTATIISGGFKARIVITSDAAPGKRDVIVTTEIAGVKRQAKLLEGFEVKAKATTPPSFCALTAIVQSTPVPGTLALTYGLAGTFGLFINNNILNITLFKGTQRLLSEPLPVPNVPVGACFVPGVGSALQLIKNLFPEGGPFNDATHVEVEMTTPDGSVKTPPAKAEIKKP